MGEALKFVFRTNAALVVGCFVAQCALGAGLVLYGGRAEYVLMAVVLFFACAALLMRMTQSSDWVANLPDGASKRKTECRITAIGACVYVVGVGASALLTVSISSTAFYANWEVFAGALCLTPVVAAIASVDVRARWGK
jgi:hypothetical protein